MFFNLNIVHIGYNNVLNINLQHILRKTSLRKKVSDILHNKSSSPCAVIIVTHNSELTLDKVIEALKKQTRLPSRVILVDSGSSNCDYLKKHQASHCHFLIDVLFYENIGFCQANNAGMAHISDDMAYVLFLNPDAFLTPTFLEQALNFMEHPQYKECAILSGTLLGYDILKDQPTGQYDSTGIFQKWYGRWYDRYQGDHCEAHNLHHIEAVPALCGALMFCRKKALESVFITKNEVFDRTFFMYKEDIDLSLRLRKAGWKLFFIPQLIAYHGRGWNKERLKVPKIWRLLSSKNEMKMHARFRSPFIIYSMAKYLSVRLFNF
jgi:GT2 family glycosyltransferase